MTELARSFALVSLASALLLPIAKRDKELAEVISGLLYLSVFLYALSRLGDLFGETAALLASVRAEVPHADILLHAAGISLLTAAAVTLCEENGQRAAARGLELLGTVEVILAAQPLFSEIFDIAGNMLFG